MTLEAARPDLTGIWLSFALLFVLPFVLIYHIKKMITPEKKVGEAKGPKRLRHYTKHYCSRHLDKLKRGEFCVVVETPKCDECLIFKIKEIR